MSAAKLQILPLRDPRPCGLRALTPKPSRSPDAPNKPKRSRAGKPKVRTGCSTCKIRKIKCDETKPACNRCTSTGRKCDGYNLPIKQHQPQAVIPTFTSMTLEPSLSPIADTNYEAQAIEFFHARTVRYLASYFDNDFWGRLIFQMCHTEPAIRHAMVALGALHRQRNLLAIPKPYRNLHIFTAYQTSNLAWRPGSSSENDEPFAMAQYTKAVSSLAARIGSSSWTPEMTLLVCILFICIEFLRGDSVQAFRHFHGGMQIAVAEMAKYETGQNHASSPNFQLLRGSLMPFFNRLELLASHWGHTATWEYPVNHQNLIPSRFDTIRQARDSIVHIMNLVMRFIRLVHYARFAGTVSPSDLVQQKAIQDQITTWRHRLQALLTSHPLNPRDLPAFQVLQLHAQIAIIWLRMCTSPDECATDSLEPQWQEILRLAESILSSRDPETSNFAFDMELVSPMYFVTIICRHPVLRRRALAIQRNISRREGLWDSNSAAIIGQRFMQIEERQLAVLDGSMLPADHDRLYNAEIDSEAGMNPCRHAVTFYQRLPGVKDGWKVWREEFVLRRRATGVEEEEEDDEELVVRTTPWKTQVSVCPSSRYASCSAAEVGTLKESTSSASIVVDV